MHVSEATSADRAAVANVLDGAALAHDDLERQIARNAVLVARRSPEAVVLGALALDGERITAIAVRPGSRGQGIGRALVAAAAKRRPRLVAAFDADLRPFYEALGFTITDESATDRFRGVLDTG
jgi:GNAT superfamily N-acetyltransferase